jgi:hypothetical protein
MLRRDRADANGCRARLAAIAGSDATTLGTDGDTARRSITNVGEFKESLVEMTSPDNSAPRHVWLTRDLSGFCSA